MPIVGVLVGLLFPRILLLYLYFATDWFHGVFSGILLPLIGFIFMPITLLWYLTVYNYFGGVWDTWQIIGMVLAVSIDLGVWKNSKKN